MKRKVICIMMSSIFVLSSVQLQMTFAEEVVSIDFTDESTESLKSEFADENILIENEDLETEGLIELETSDPGLEILSECMEDQKTEITESEELQSGSEFSDEIIEDIEVLQQSLECDIEEEQDIVSDGKYNGFYYDVTDENEITITGYKGKAENSLVIPDTISGYPVTAIGNGAFSYCTNISGQLILPEAIRDIGDSAFQGCSGLTGELVLPNGLETIGNYAFYDCSGFTGNLILPEELEKLGSYAFKGCTGYSDSSQGFSGKLVIPSTVLSIGENVFGDGKDFEVTSNGHVGVNTYFYRVENYSNESLDMTQFMGKWYNLETKTMLLNDNHYLEQGTAVLVPYLMRIGTPDFARVGETRKVKYSFYPEKLDEDCPAFMAFSSSDPSVVQVDSQGFMIAKGVGTALITGTDLTGRISTDKIEVVDNKSVVKKGNLTWYIPEEIGLGYSIANLHSESSGCISIVKATDLPSDSLGKNLVLLSSGTISNPFWGCDYIIGPHACEGDAEIYKTSASFGYASYDTATYPGTLSLQLKIGGPYQNGDWINAQIIGKPYTITVKKPVIETNEPSIASVGEACVLTSELKDTALQNTLVSDYKRGNSFYHSLVYQPSFEIIEGSDLVECSDGDFTHMLKASEKIIFKKAGTVKIRIRYNPVFLCNWCERNAANSYYVPEKTITLKIEEPVTSLETAKLGKVKSSGYNKLSLTWSAVPNATGYIIYRKKGSQWKKIATTSANSYVHVSSREFPIKTGETYVYTVKAYRKTGSSTIYGGYDKTGMKGKTIAEKPVLTSVSSPSYNQVKLKWKKAAGATGYIVYRKNSKNGWEKLATLKGNVTSYTHTSSRKFPVIVGKTYTYTVRSYTSAGKTYGQYDHTGKTIKVSLAAPKWSGIKKNSSGLRLQWKKVEGASGYAVYRYEKGKWKQLTKTKKLYYTDSKTKKGVVYKYAVKAYRTVNKKSVYSDMSKTKSGRR